MIRRAGVAAAAVAGRAAAPLHGDRRVAAALPGAVAALPVGRLVLRPGLSPGRRGCRTSVVRPRLAPWFLP